MSTGFSQAEGDAVTATTVGSPSDIKYQMGIKDPKQLMRYAEGTGAFSHTFAITIKRQILFLCDQSGQFQGTGCSGDHHQVADGAGGKVRLTRVK